MKIYIVYNSAILKAENIELITEDKNHAMELLEQRTGYVCQSGEVLK